MSKSKKVILAVSMLLVLAVAAYLNFALLNPNGEQDGGNDVVPVTSFFTNYRSNWEEIRTEEINNLNEIIATEGDEYAQARATATLQKQKIVELMETEMLLESLLKAKGYNELIVTMGVDSSNVNVITSAEQLTVQDTAIIYNTIVSELGLSPDYIKILPI